MEKILDIEKKIKQQKEIAELSMKVLSMEKGLEQLRHCCSQHKQSIMDMERNIMDRVTIIQGSSHYGQQVKIFKKFQSQMLAYIQSHSVQRKLQYRRETNRNMQALILQMEEKIQEIYKQIHFYEKEIEYLQWLSLGEKNP